MATVTSHNFTLTRVSVYVRSSDKPWCVYFVNVCVCPKAAQYIYIYIYIYTHIVYVLGELFDIDRPWPLSIYTMPKTHSVRFLCVFSRWAVWSVYCTETGKVSLQGDCSSTGQTAVITANTYERRWVSHANFKNPPLVEIQFLGTFPASKKWRLPWKPHNANTTGKVTIHPPACDRKWSKCYHSNQGQMNQNWIHVW